MRSLQADSLSRARQIDPSVVSTFDPKLGKDFRLPSLPGTSHALHLIFQAFLEVYHFHFSFVFHLEGLDLL